MNEMNILSDQFRRLAKSLPEHAGPEIEQRLLEEFRAHHHRRTRRSVYLAGAAALLLVAFALSSMFVLNSRRLMSPARGSSAHELDAAAAFSGFVPLPYAQSGVPLGQAVVVRVQLRASDLTSLGAPVPAGDPRQRIGADVLIGQDGVARAIHFLQ